MVGPGLPPRPDAAERAAARAERAERDARAARMAVTGHTYDEIAAALGFRSRQGAQQAVKRLLARRLKDAGAAADEFRAKQDALLDEALKVATEIMDRRHLAVANGKVVQRYDEKTGQYTDVYDDSINLAAADRLIKISESRRKMYGADAPAKTEVSGQTTVRYEIAATADEMEKL